MATRPYIRKQRTVYFGSGSRRLSRPYVNKRNRLILGSGKKKCLRRKQKGRGWGNLIAQGFNRRLKKIFG